MIFRDIPIQQKLIRIIMLTCSVTLLLMAGLYIVFEIFSFRKAEANKQSTRALIISSNSTAALAFDSPKDATEILAALHADKYMAAASLYDANGRLFAKYPADAEDQAFPASPGKKGFRFKGDFLEVFQPVVQRNMKLGTLYMKASIAGVYKQIYFNLLIAFMLIALILVLAYFLSRFLQRAISEPLLSLERTAKHISEKGDYTSRAVKMGNDELGSLTEAFNHMLSQIETQNQELIHVNEESSKLAAIVEYSGDIIVGSSLDLVITSWNKSAERQLGYTSEEMLGRLISTIIATPHANRSDMLERLKQGQQIKPFETKFVRKDKEILDISLTISPVKNSAGDTIGISLIARDITAQKINERKIIQNEEHLRLATEAAELGTFDMDLLADTLTYDTRAKELFGIAPEEPVTFQEGFLQKLHTEDRERISRIVQSAFNKKFSNGNYDVEFRTANKDDKFRWLKTKGKVFFDETERPVRFIGSVLDISSQKHEEAKKNDFIAIISHELKTPITVIKSYLQILLAKAKKDPENTSINALTRAEAQTNKMSSMIKDFLNLARIEAGKIMLIKEEFDLGMLLEETVAEARLLSSSHNIKLDYSTGIRINADKDKIGQVLINLVSNAIKYSPVGSTITVGCSKQNGILQTFVQDEGVGISMADQKELFTRFYRVFNEKTKTVSGFGIGLYIVSQILKQHDSEINMVSEPGVGSTFSFCLPAVA